MATIDPKDFIEELRFDIREKDKIKAKLVLSHLFDMTGSIRKIALLELLRADDEFAIPLMVETLVSGRNKSEKFNDLKEILYSKVLGNPDIFLNLLIREAKSENKVLLAQVAGEIRLEAAEPILIGMLNEAGDEAVLKSAIGALGMIGDSASVTPISEYLYSNEVELTIAAIYALGSLGTPTAIQRLAEKLGADTDLDVMIVDLFANIQSPESIEKLNETLSSNYAGLRNTGKTRIVEIGIKAVPTLMKNLVFDDPDLLIHTLNVLGEIGDDSAIPAIKKLLFHEPKNPNIRFAAYEALGMMPVAKGAFALAQGLSDPESNVRTAAAAAIDRNYDTVLAAGLKNMIRGEEAEVRQITKTLINAQCDTIFLDLMDEEAFERFTVEFLSEGHPDTRTHFINLLNKNGKREMAEKIAATGKIEEKPALKVFAVDDSKMILNIYRGILHNLGFNPLLFQFPAEAIDKVKDEKPDIIFTDLNMPDINGIELTKKIRQWFDKEQLPIIMVTTQNESHDNEAAYEAGINAILHKPFSADKLGKAVADLNLTLTSVCP